MTFTTFSEYLTKLGATSSRIEMMKILSELFQHLKGEEIEQASYLLEGRLVPQYFSLEFQLSVKMVLRALARIYSANETGSTDGNTTLFGEADNSLSETFVEKSYKTLGDIGLVAEQIIPARKQSKLSIADVYQSLSAIARESGEGSQERKLAALIELLLQLDPESAKYVTRIIVGRMRLGFSTMTMLDALSWATTGAKDATEALEEAFQKKADFGKLARVYLEAEDETARKKALEKYDVEVGIPIVPQLCQRLNDPEEVIEKMTEVIVEPKYDGLRVQIHFVRHPKSGNMQYTAYTRNLEEVSAMFPELEQLAQYVSADTLILDAEAIGFDPKPGKLLLFQETMNRKRKHLITETAAKIPLRFFIFDVLSIDGKSLISEKLRERKDVLKKLFKKNELFVQTDFITTTDPKELQTYHEQKLSEGLEGVVIKQIDAPYQSGRKNWYWVKLKEKTGTQGKLSDTLDVVVMGYYVGRGKRTAFGIGAFLVGVLESENKFVTIAKIGTGLSDDQFKELKKRADTLIAKAQPKEYQVDKALFPDVWITPEIVVEVAADELTKSPNHSAGYALRFPRLVKFRDDKDWQNATTVTEVLSMLGINK
jgi:DNA ligase-1